MCSFREFMFTFIYVLYLFSLFESTDGAKNETEIGHKTEVTKNATDIPHKAVKFQEEKPFIHGIEVKWELPSDLKESVAMVTVHCCETERVDLTKPDGVCKTFNMTSTNVTRYHIPGLHAFTRYRIWLEFNMKSGMRYYSEHHLDVRTDGVVCNCDPHGTVPGTTCDQHTGRCECKEPHFTGLSCDMCMPGFFHDDKSEHTVCLACPCTTLRSGDDTSCVYIPGGAIKCSHCVPPYTGRLCKDCIAGYYKGYVSTTSSPHRQEGCLPCSCNGYGDKDRKGGECDSDTGECFCTQNTGGRNCTKCAEGFKGVPGNCTLINTSDAHMNTDSKIVKEDNSATTGAIIGVSVVLGLLLLALLGYIAWRKYKIWKRSPGQFWTVELSQDTDDLTLPAESDWHDHYNSRDDTQLINSNSYTGRFSAPPGEEPNPYRSITMA